MNLPSLFVLFIGGWGVAPKDKQNLFYFDKRSFLDEFISAYPSVTIEKSTGNLFNTYQQLAGKVGAEKTILQILSEHDIRLISISGAERHGVFTSVLDSDQSIINEANTYYCATPPSTSLIQTPETSLPEISKLIEAQMKYTKDTVVFASIESIETMLHYQDASAIHESIVQTDKYLKKIIQQALMAGIRVLLVGDTIGAEAFGQGQSTHQQMLLPAVFIAKDQEGLRASDADYASNDVFPLTPSGAIQDIAPTILSLMHIPKPEYLPGKNLFTENF